MNMTKKQKDIVSQARRFKENNFSTMPFGQLYLRFCDDGFVKPHRFLNLVQETNVYTLPKKVNPLMDVNTFVQQKISKHG